MAKEPLIAVSAPLQSDGGSFAGIVGGSLNLARMGNFERYNPGVENAAIVVLDRVNRVVFAGRQTPYRVLEDLSDSELTRSARRAKGATAIRYSRKVGEANEHEAFLAGHSIVPEYEWIVFVEAPASLIRQELLGLYLRLAAWAGVGIGLCFLLAHIVAWRYTRPLEQLVSHVAQLAPSGTQDTMRADGAVPAEVANLIDSFRDLSGRLAEADAARRTMLLNLEEQVQVRTAELEEARARAEEASNAKSVFLATMSHEIRTPLNGVLGTIGLLESTQLSSEQREYASIALQSAESLLVILNDILDLAKIEACRLTLEDAPFELVTCLKAAIAPFRMQAYAKGLRINTSWSSASPMWVSGDSGRLRQVLSNLLGNAIKFTPSGTIDIDADWRLDNGHLVRIEISVKDSGVGIPEALLSRLFTPFVQASDSTTRQFGGTGLGLAISKQLLELMGGRFAVESEPDVGSLFRFFVVLPLAQNDAALTESGPTRHQLQPAALEGARVLLVEDNGVNRLVAGRLLSKLGCAVVEAATGMEALSAWSEDTFDVILMDCQMPEMDGYEATREIRNREVNRRTPIVAMTASAMSGDQEKCLAAGMDDFIAKPAHPKDVAAVLSRALLESKPSRRARTRA